MLDLARRSLSLAPDGDLFVFESSHFRFLVASSEASRGSEAWIREQAARSSQRLELFYDGLKAEGLVPVDDQIDILLVEIPPASEPSEGDRGVDIIEGEEVGLRGFYDSRLRAEWLERDVVKVCVSEAVGREAASRAFLIDGLVGALAERARHGDRRAADDGVSKTLEAGARVDLRALLDGSAEVSADAFRRAAISFVCFILERAPGGAFRAFLVGLANDTPDRAAANAFRKSLAALEEDWKRTLDRSRAGTSGSLGFIARFFTFGKSEWSSIAGVLVAITIGIAFDAAIPLATRFILDKAIAPRNFDVLWVALGVLAVLFVLQAFTGILREHMAARTGARMTDALRLRLFARLQDLSSSYYGRSELGDVVSRMTVDANFVEQGFTEAVPATMTLVLGLALNLVLLFVLAPRLATLTLIAVPLTTIGMRWAIPKSGRAVQERQALRADVGAFVAESFQAQSVVRAFGLAPVVTGRFQKIVSALGESNRKVVFFTGVVALSAALPVALVQLGALGVGAWFVLAGRLTVGTLVAFLSVLAGVLGPLKALAWAVPSLQRASASLDRLGEILSEEPDVRDKPGAEPMQPILREIAFDDVTFTYTGDRTNLDGVSLRVPVGQSVVFVGPSGSGKSTILNLVMRFYDPTRGALRVDGNDLRDLSLASIRSRVSVVFQESFLFNTTIRENIRLGKLDATDREVEAAAKLAEIHDIVLALPDGYDTKVGERGSRLSGGQRQRIAIARAMIRDPWVLVLDEATSALDARTEAAISDTLRRACKGRTVLSVTHRLAWAEDADLVVVLDKGRVVEQGTHTALLANDGLYRRLWDHQRGFVVNDKGRIVGIEPERLATIVIFQDLGPTQLRELASEFVIHRRAAGDVVFEEGDLADKFYVVGRGQVEVEAVDPSGSRRKLATLRDGDPFGEIGLLMDRKRTATVTVSVPTELLVLDGSRFLELMKAHPAVRESLTDRMATMLGGPKSIRSAPLSKRTGSVPPGAAPH